MKIDILGWYNRGNVGDDAFELVFKEWFKGHDLRFVTPPEQTRPNADLVILGGGAVTSEYYLQEIRPFVGSKGGLISLGVDMEWAEEAILLMNAGFSYVVFRSREDVEFFRAHLAVCADNLPAPVRTAYCPDIAFGLSSSGEDVASRYRVKPDRKLVGVFLTDYVMPSFGRGIEHFGPRCNQFAEGMGGYLDKISEKAEVILLPCSTGETGNDKRINLHVAAFMRHPPTIIEERLSPQDMIDFMVGCTATICMRFHAHIFSIIAGTPFVSIEFTKKVRTLIEDYGKNLPRELTAVTRGEDKYFDFDHAIERTVSALEAGVTFSETDHAHRYAQTCREQGELVREIVLSKFLNAV